MPDLYATAAEVTEFAADSDYALPEDTGDDPTPLVRLIERAQADVDSALGEYEIITTGDYAGLKLDVTTLDFAQAQAIRRATCQQVLYRLEMGERFFVRPQLSEVVGPEFETKGRMPRVGPAAKAELAGMGLVRKTTTIARRRRGPRWLGFAYNIDEGDGDYGGLAR